MNAATSVFKYAGPGTLFPFNFLCSEKKTRRNIERLESRESRISAFLCVSPVSVGLSIPCPVYFWQKSPFPLISLFNIASHHKQKQLKWCLLSLKLRPRSIYQYSNMAPRLSGQNSIFGVVFFVSKSLLGIEGQKKLEKFAILTRKPRSRARILIYRTWPIGN